MDKLKDDKLAWYMPDREGESAATTSTADLLATAGPAPDSAEPGQMGVFVRMTQTSTISYVSTGSNASATDLSGPPPVKQSIDLPHRQDTHSRNASITSIHGGPSQTDLSSRAHTSSDGLPSSQSSHTPMVKTPSRGSGTGSGSFHSSSPATPAVVADVWESKAIQKVVQRFVESSDVQIATDITRLDWKYFEQIHPRSLLTHCYSGGSEEGGDAVLRQFSSHFNDLSSLCVSSRAALSLIHSITHSRLRISG